MDAPGVCRRVQEYAEACRSMKNFAGGQRRSCGDGGTGREGVEGGDGLLGGDFGHVGPKITFFLNFEILCIIGLFISKFSVENGYDHF